MADTATKAPVKKSGEQAATTPAPRTTPTLSLRDEINRLFDTFDAGFGRWPSPRALFGADMLERAHVHAPAVDIAETEQAFELTAELPGMSEADVNVELVNGDLRIKGEKKEEREKKEKDYYLSERRFGAFERRFRLPDGVDANKIEATFADGVLKVTLPKTAAAAPKRVQINAK